MSYAADPQVVWDALAAGGWNPRGRPTDFYSRCPEHQGEGHSLHVTLIGGRVLLYCFAHGCEPQEIVERLGLRMADLFESDQSYDARLPRARRDDFTTGSAAREVANVLLAVERLGLRWRVSIELDECPDCESPHPELVVPSTGEPFAHCTRGCGPEAFKGALAEALRRRR